MLKRPDPIQPSGYGRGTSTGTPARSLKENAIIRRTWTNELIVGASPVTPAVPGSTLFDVAGSNEIITRQSGYEVKKARAHARTYKKNARIRVDIIDGGDTANGVEKIRPR